MKYVLCLVLIICGCTHSDEMTQERQAVEAAQQASTEFHVGDIINIKLGGQGMVIGYAGFRGQTIVIRTGPAGHYERRTFAVFELEKP